MPVNSVKINFPGMYLDYLGSSIPAENTGFTVAIKCNDVHISGIHGPSGTIDIDILAEDGELITNDSITIVGPGPDDPDDPVIG